MDPYLQQKDKWIDAYEEAVRLYNRYEEEICTEKGKGISVVKGKVREGVWVHIRTVEKRVY